MYELLMTDSHVGRTKHRQYGSVYNRILLDGINCAGTEKTLDECKDANWDVIDCDNNDEVSISCPYIQYLKCNCL